MVLKNKMVVIVGPTATGKSTLAKKVQKSCPNSVMISREDIIEEMIQHPTKGEIYTKFRFFFLQKIKEALEEEGEPVIIIDMLNHQEHSLVTFLNSIRNYANYQDGITLIKMNPTMNLHKKMIQEAKKEESSLRTSQILLERESYFSPMGSFYPSFLNLVEEEVIIEKPNKEEFTFEFQEKPKVYAKS